MNPLYAQESRLHFFGSGSRDKSSHDHVFLNTKGSRGQARHRQPHQFQLTADTFGFRDGGGWGKGPLACYPCSGKYMASLRVEQGKYVNNPLRSEIHTVRFELPPQSKLYINRATSSAIQLLKKCARFRHVFAGMPSLESVGWLFLVPPSQLSGKRRLVFLHQPDFLFWRRCDSSEVRILQLEILGSRLVVSPCWVTRYSPVCTYLVSAH